MTITVSDARSNYNDQISHAANVLKRSARLRKMFEAICRGGKKPKTVTNLRKATRFGQVPVLQLAGKLADQQLVHKTKVDGETAYAKDRFYAANRAKILRYAGDSAKLRALPTKVSPNHAAGGAVLRAMIQGARAQLGRITCDDIDQFSKIRRARAAKHVLVPEQAFKKGIQRLIGETGKFQDWGGEKNDLYTSKVRVKGRRRTVAFAFKGPGTTGILTPKRLGKGANQIQRLFVSPAEVFIVQYHGQIHEDVIQQMEAFATLNAVREARRIWYGVIDGDDTDRLLAAYPKQFGLK